MVDRAKTGESASNEMTIAREFSEKVNNERIRSKIIDVAPLITLIIIFLIMSFFVQGFFSRDNILGLLNQIAAPLVLASGLTFVIILGCIDLSVEGVMGLAGSVVALLVINTKNSNNFGLWSILIVIAIGIIVGFLNGLLYVKLRIPSFMVTFGMWSIALGLAVLSYGGAPPGIIEPAFDRIVQGRLFGFPYITIIAIGIFLIGLTLQKYTAFGQYIYAIGENESILSSIGINVQSVKIRVFMFSGFCASFAGIFGAMRLNRGDATLGTGMLFTAITAVVLGGTSLSGGKGGLLQTLVGVIIVSLLRNAMILLGVSPYIQPAVQGLIIILVVSLTVTRGRKLIVK